MKKDVNYALGMAFCGGAILVIICVWYFVQGIGDGLQAGFVKYQETANQCEKCVIDCNLIIENLEKMSISELTGLRKRIEDLKFDFEIDNSGFLKAFSF